jgi:hypothetical protein
MYSFKMLDPYICVPNNPKTIWDFTCTSVSLHLVQPEFSVSLKVPVENSCSADMATYEQVHGDITHIQTMLEE